MAKTVDQLVVEIRAETRQLRKGLDGVNKKLNKTKKSTKGANDAFKKMKAALVAIGAAQVIGKVVEINRTFEDLEATLRAVTGSAEAAGKSFELIRAFTANTTFQIEEVAQAFITLKQAGIVPTSDALNDFGNFAAGMGKSITQLAQAAFNATTGEMEMLKQFGIIARQQGDKITVTFDGTTKTIERNGEAITEYIRSIGREKFSTAIEERFNTLSGSISTVNDQVSEFAVAIGDGAGGVGLRSEFIKLNKATASLIETLRPLGQLIGFIIGAIAGLIAELVMLVDALLVISRLFYDVTSILRLYKDITEGNIKSFDDFKESVRGGTGDLEALDSELLSLVKTGGDFRKTFSASEEKDFKLFEDLRKQVEKTRSGVRDLIEKDFARLRKIVTKTVEAQLKLDIAASIDAGDPTIGRTIERFGDKFFQINEGEVEKRRKQFTKKLLGVENIEEFITEITDNTDIIEKELGDLSETFGEALAPAIQSASMAFTTDFVDALLDGQNALQSFKDFSRNIVSQIIAIFLQMEVVNKILNAIFHTDGMGLGGKDYAKLPTSNILGNAGGGTMQPNTPRLVGERGPEIFVPNTGGTIMNNMNSKNAMGGGGTTIINQSINFATGVVPTVRAEVTKMMPQIADVTKAAVQESAMRGGNFRRSLVGG